MRYELLYLVGASKEAELPKIKEGIEGLVKELGGVLEEKEVIEKRRLAYDIKHEGHGIYVAQRFELENPENLEELKNKLNLNQDVFRFMISKASELPELKTKEERERQHSDREASMKNDQKEEKKEETKKSEEPKKKESPSPEKKEEKKPETEEDIDKKLEEILNI